MTKWECKIVGARESQIEKHLEFYLEKGFEPVNMCVDKVGVYDETYVLVMLRRPVID